jgi:hypothetical protein
VAPPLGSIRRSGCYECTISIAGNKLHGSRKSSLNGPHCCCSRSSARSRPSLTSVFGKIRNNSAAKDRSPQRKKAATVLRALRALSNGVVLGGQPGIATKALSNLFARSCNRLR